MIMKLKLKRVSIPPIDYFYLRTSFVIFKAKYISTAIGPRLLRTFKTHHR
jgi:hypothetical protein